MKSFIIAATLAASVTTASTGPFGTVGMAGSFEQMQTRQQLWRLEGQLDDIQQAQRRAANSAPVYVAPPRPVPRLPWEYARPNAYGCYGCDQ